VAGHPAGLNADWIKETIMSYAYTGFGASASASVEVDFRADVNSSSTPKKPPFSPLDQPAAVCGDAGIASVIARDNGTWSVSCNDGIQCSGTGPNDNGFCQKGSKPVPPPPPPPAPAGTIPKISDKNSSGSSCPPATGTQYPSGLSSQHLALINSLRAAGAEKMICNQNILGNDLLAAAAAECNTSLSPIYCYFAKAYNQSFLGRGGSSDVAAWRAWHPAAAGQKLFLAPLRLGVPSGGMTTKTGTLATPPPVIDGSGGGGIPTWALVLGGVAVLGGVGYLVMKKRLRRST